MAKGGITKKIEDTIKALDDNQLKKALYLTENNPKLQRHHQWVEEAARTCLANKDNKSVCKEAIKAAREKIHATITLPIEDDSLEGLEEYMSDSQIASETSETPAPEQAKASDEELFENCEECHVAVTASTFANVCAEYKEAAGSCELISRSLENENTEPVDWLKAMIQTAEQAQGEAKEKMLSALSELTSYLQKRNSPFLEALDKEG